MGTPIEQAATTGIPVSWYPIALSTELVQNRVIAKEVFGTRVIVYRASSGTPIVQGSYCPHLGTDLAEGDIIDGEIRCPLHHWKFNKTGVCSHIPTGDKIPPGARIATYPSREAWGLIWAFNGPTALFELPTIPDTDESEVFYDTLLRDVLPIEPWMIRSNTVDFQHFRALHGFQATEPRKLEVEQFKVEFTLKLDEIGFEQHARITGTNTFSQRFHYGAHSRFYDFGKTFGGEDVFFLFTGAPVPEGSTFFQMIGVRKPSTDDPAAIEQARYKVKKLREFADSLYENDRRVFMTIRYRQGTLIASDRLLAQFLKHVREYPRVLPADMESAMLSRQAPSPGLSHYDGPALVVESAVARNKPVN